MKSSFLLTGLAIVALALSGCGEGGPPVSEVEGVVTYKGAPVEGAQVTLGYDDGKQAMGTTDASGKFELGSGSKPGAPLGSAVVTITKFASAAPVVGGSPEDMMKMQKEGSSASPTNQLPAKYASGETSGLTADIKAGGKQNNQLKYDLTD